MNTIMKKNRPMTLTSSMSVQEEAFRTDQLVLVDARAIAGVVFCSSMPQPLLSTTVPGPSDEYQPGGTGALYQLPQPIAKP